MGVSTLNIFPNDMSNEALVGDVIGKLVSVLLTAGASCDWVNEAFRSAIASHANTRPSVKVVQLGVLQRECMEVLCRWRRDPRFLDQNGIAAKLPLDSSEASFSALCIACGCSSDPQHIVAKLLEFGAVTPDQAGWVLPTTPTFLVGRRTSPDGAVALEAVLQQLTGFVGVLHQNLCGLGASQRPRFERSCSVVISAELVPIFEQLVLRRGQEFVDSIDEWLERHKRATSQGDLYSEVGVGAYFVDLGRRKGR